MAHSDEVDLPGQKKSFGAKARSFGRSIWNPQKKEFIGRTGSSWAKIGLFYLIFYSCLAGFFAIMLTGFFATLSDTEPTQQDYYSLIKKNPGMGFRPMVTVESTLITFKGSDAKTYDKLVKNIEDFLAPYKNDSKHKNEVECNGDEPADGKFCAFHVDTLGIDCAAANQYGYKSYEVAENDTHATPCVLLKINKVFNWKPEAFQNETDNKREQEARAALITPAGDRFSYNNIGISCEGENEADKDNLGVVDYYPNLGFPFEYFPYKNVEGYEAPLVFARFTNARRGALIQVWCKLWARNIMHHKNDKAGSAHFELLVDN